MDDRVFKTQVAPQLIEDWRDGHWLINHLRRATRGFLDADIWASWQRVYMFMMAAGVHYTVTPDSDPNAGDYAMLPTERPLPISPIP